MTAPQVKSLSPKQAWDLIQENPRAVMIDVRSDMEYLFIGHPAGSIHVPWIDLPDWKINPHFASEVRKVMLGGLSCDNDSGCAPIILICRSGKRSLEAGHALIDDGFTEIYNVLEGFEGDLDKDHHRSTLGGWRFHGLPWKQC
ncbi:MAG: rhodanese-like domain-containing protein [Gammaproteobacteria bacterium]|nr:rhodanese-like domain-containing protein [Gammaproteobacteria bacterium]MCK5091373.1 rhodanese-like domain-containing protein [Gammaproteobacteria bacterium]